MDDLTRMTGDGRDRWCDRLSEYVDGGMPPAERARLEAHLSGCAACTVALADIREVVAHARSLTDAPPTQDLWPAIEARLEPRAAASRGHARPPADGRAWWARRLDLGIPQLAAAAFLLVALSSGTVWLAMRRPSTPGPSPAASIATAIPADRMPPEAASAGLEDPRYSAAVAELERALEAGQGKLDPRTLRVVEQNLRVIDGAIDEARRAVVADPGNTWLRSHLASTMKRKVELLRSAAMIAGQS